jgi:hypothetical protein
MVPDLASVDFTLAEFCQSEGRLLVTVAASLVTKTRQDIMTILKTTLFIMNLLIMTLLIMTLFIMPILITLSTGDITTYNT